MLRPKVELRSPFLQKATTLPIAGKGNLQAKVCGRQTIHGVERDRALRGGAERSEFLPEGVMCKVVGGRYIQRSASRRH